MSEIVTSNTPKDAASLHVKAVAGAKARRIPGGWKVTEPSGKTVLYMNRTKWFRHG